MRHLIKVILYLWLCSLQISCLKCCNLKLNINKLSVLNEKKRET